MEEATALRHQLQFFLREKVLGKVHDRHYQKWGQRWQVAWQATAGLILLANVWQPHPDYQITPPRSFELWLQELDLVARVLDIAPTEDGGAPCCAKTLEFVYGNHEAGRTFEHLLWYSLRFIRLALEKQARPPRSPRPLHVQESASLSRALLTTATRCGIFTGELCP